MPINTKPVEIISPMAWGNGAYVVHRTLERHIDGYKVRGYHPNWTFIPLSINKIAPRQNARLVHTTPDYAFFSHCKNIPLIISFQNYVLDHWMGQYSTWWQRLHYRTDLRLWTRMAVKKAAIITAVSKFTGELVKKDLNVKRRIQVIYNAADEKVFTPGNLNKPNTKEVRVLYSGNLTLRKGAHWLPAIADKLDKHVRIYYTQGLRTRNTLSEHANLRSIGPVPFEEMPARYRQMDILLMPTVREGFSLSVLEAMACGLPVVASDCSSLPEQIDEGQGGFLCPVGAVDCIAERLNQLADSSKERKEMGQFNRSKIEEHFTVEKMINEYKRLFETILV